jgi:hypothetical protein
MAAKKPFKAIKKRPQIKKVRKSIRNTNAKSPKTKARRFRPQQDNDEDKQQSLTYARRKSASSKPMNQFVKIEQFNALANNMSKLIEAANKIQDRIISMDAKLDILIAMFQRNNQTISPDVM